MHVVLVLVVFVVGHRRLSGWGRTHVADDNNSPIALAGRVTPTRWLVQPVLCCRSTACSPPTRNTPVVTRLYCSVLRRRPAVASCHSQSHSAWSESESVIAARRVVVVQLATRHARMHTRGSRNSTAAADIFWRKLLPVPVMTWPTSSKRTVSY